MPSPPLSIVQSLSPRIAVLTSEDVVAACEANGCRGLEELLRPWESATDRVSILSSTLTPTIHPTFPLRFVSYDSIFTNPALSSPDPDMILDMIGSSVGARKPDDEQHYPLTRALLLSSRQLTPHETFNHPVGIMYAISTSTPDPLATLGKLHAQTMGAMGTNTPWMDGISVMKLFVVVHDVSRMGEDLEQAKELLASVKKAHGPHSTLLVINSQLEHRPPPPSPDVATHPSIPLPRPFTPDNVTPSSLSQVYASALSSLTLSPMTAASSILADGQAVADTSSSPSQPARRKLYGQKLTAEDTQRLAALVRELVVQSLIPWMEARIREWNEVYSHNRRGITGRLFGAGRKLFGSRPNSPAPNAAQAGYNSVKGYYPTYAIEAVSRRLADFAFMLRDYKFASGIYDSLRRDFAQDRAWRYAAAATEMYGLSLLLSHNYFLPSSPPNRVPNPFTTLQHTDITSWFEQAVLAYHSRAPANQIQLDALRISILYYEAWKTIGEWRGVGISLVKGAGEADEVPCAVLIEEAAAADLKGGKTERGRRRRAHHLVMAARRYETAGFKAFSRRCLDRASQIYRATPWTAAQDRIEYSLGRQAYTLGESDVAVEHFLRLLRREDTGVQGSQEMILEDMALAYEQLVAHPKMLEAARDRLILPTPIFDTQKTTIVTEVAESSSSGTNDEWDKLEEQALSTWDRKGKKPLRLLPDPARRTASVQREFRVELTATNPLNSGLALTDIRVSLTGAEDISSDSLEEVRLEPYESRMLSIPITIPNPGVYTLASVKFGFNRFFPYEQSLARRGRRLHATKQHRINPTYADDSTLTISIAPSRPTATVSLDVVARSVYEGEEVPMVLHIRNTGAVPFDQVQLFSEANSLIRVEQDVGNDNAPASIPGTIPPLGPLLLHSRSVGAGHSISIPITYYVTQPNWIDIRGLIIASSTESADEIMSVQLAHSLSVQPSLVIQSSTKPSRNHLGQHTVIVEVTNTADTDLKLDRIGAISHVWSSPQPDALDVVLSPNQTYRTVVNVKAQSDPTVDIRQTRLVNNLEKLLDNQEESLDLQKPDSSSISISTVDLATYRSSRLAYRARTLHTGFPTITTGMGASLFPLMDPLDLDISIAWSIPDDSRRGHVFQHAIRVGPRFSIVEELRSKVEAAIASGSKQTRTMYEETGRLRKLLLDSVLDGELSREDDPLIVRAYLENAKGGASCCDFRQGPCVVPVRMEIHNLSPLLSTRYLLNLPSISGTSSKERTYTPARHVGQLEHRGTVFPGETYTLNTSIWVSEPTLVELGWDLRVETGEVMDDIWVVRKAWHREERGGVWKLEQSSA